MRHRISKNTIVCFVFAMYCWVQNPLFSVVGIPSETPMGKLIFPLQEVIDWGQLSQERELMSTYPSQCCDSPVQALCMLPQSVNSYVLQPHCAQKSLFPWCYSSHLVFIIFLLPILHFSLIPRTGLYESIPFRTMCSKVSHCLYFVQLLVSVFVLIYYRKKHLQYWMIEVRHI